MSSIEIVGERRNPVARCLEEIPGRRAELERGFSFAVLSGPVSGATDWNDGTRQLQSGQRLA